MGSRWDGWGCWLLLQIWDPARTGGDVGYWVVIMQISHAGLGDTNIPSRWDGLLHFTPRVGATKMASRWDAGVGWGVPVGRVGRWGCWASLCDGFGGVKYQPALIFNSNFVNHIWACPTITHHSSLITHHSSLITPHSSLISYSPKRRLFVFSF